MPPTLPNRTAGRVITYAQKRHDDNGNEISLLPLLTNSTGITHVIVAAIHLNEGPGNIHLNDDPPEHPKYQQLWNEVQWLQGAGIGVLGMLGGAAKGSYERLAGDDASVRHPLSTHHPVLPFTSISSFSNLFPHPVRSLLLASEISHRAIFAIRPRSRHRGTRSPLLPTASHLQASRRLWPVVPHHFCTCRNRSASFLASPLRLLLLRPAPGCGQRDCVVQYAILLWLGRRKQTRHIRCDHGGWVASGEGGARNCDERGKWSWIRGAGSFCRRGEGAEDQVPQIWRGHGLGVFQLDARAKVAAVGMGEGGSSGSDSRDTSRNGGGRKGSGETWGGERVAVDAARSFRARGRFAVWE